MTRIEWQALAERWLVDAKHLLDQQRWSAAYYLAGYAVECGLKSCVLARVAAAPEVIFAEKKFSERCWTHGIVGLLRLADLQRARKAVGVANPLLELNWLLADLWDEKSRYNTSSAQKAQNLYEAITDPVNGVMPWIRGRW